MQGYSGDGGPATSALLKYPVAIAVDNAGNVYFSDNGNDCIRKITVATGIITTIAGNGIQGYSGDGGVATSARLSYPFGIAVDGSGNIYFADWGNQRIRKVNAATGMITTIAGTGMQGYSGDGGTAINAQFNRPYGLTLDRAGDLYIAEAGNNCIRKITAANGIITTIAGTGNAGFSGDAGLATAAQLQGPIGVAVDSSGNVYIADEVNDRIRKISPGTSTAVPAITARWPNTLSVYPSPCNGRFTIAANTGAIHSGECLQIELINSLGQNVYSNIVTPAGAQWSIPVQVGAGVANGLYQLRVSAGGASAVRSLVIKR